VGTLDRTTRHGSGGEGALPTAPSPTCAPPILAMSMLAVRCLRLPSCSWQPASNACRAVAAADHTKGVCAALPSKKHRGVSKGGVICSAGCTSHPTNRQGHVRPDLGSPPTAATSSKGCHRPGEPAALAAEIFPALSLLSPDALALLPCVAAQLCSSSRRSRSFTGRSRSSDTQAACCCSTGAALCTPGVTAVSPDITRVSPPVPLVVRLVCRLLQYLAQVKEGEARPHRAMAAPAAAVSDTAAVAGLLWQEPRGANRGACRAPDS
jgi:hypothetical protein